LASFKVQEDVLRSILDKNNYNGGIISFIAKTTTTTLTTKQGAESVSMSRIEEPTVENVSSTLGCHMESIEHLDLQPWQVDTIQALQKKVVGQHTKLTTEDVCVPPALHISTSFCCGGNTKRLREQNTIQGHVNNPFACADKTVHDYERVRDIALRYMAPLPIDLPSSATSSSSSTNITE
jgi:hypothetical protein